METRIGSADDDRDPGPVGPESSQRDPDTTVHIRQPRPIHRTLEDGEPLAESEIFQPSECCVLSVEMSEQKKRPIHAEILASYGSDCHFRRGHI